jgi:hypothetical protein
MIGSLPHYAFIDGQNIYLGVKDAGWKVDWKKLRVLLREHYKVEQAFFFIGFIPTNQALYTFL